MRPGQNKRMRGRNNNNNNRKGPNPLTRSYESNGPDVKIRGTAHHIGEKYLQLARDAQSSGDPVMAESYLQHAEHYFRLIASAQQAQQQVALGYPRQGDQIDDDDGDDDDFGGLPDRFASPAERAPPTPPPQPQQPYQERQPYQNGGDRQPAYEPRPDRQPYDRNAQQPNQDRPQQDRQPNGGDRQDRSYENRNNRGDRNGGYQDRNNQDRNGQGNGGERGNYEPRGDRPQRDYDNRNFRNNRGPRDFRDNNGQPREAREPRPPVEEPTNGLPAFITAPTRPVMQDSEAQPHIIETTATADAGGEDGFQMRPRRRRRPKSEFGETEGRHDAPATDPVGD